MTKDERWLLREKYRGVPSAAFEADCERLARGEPLAYVIGHQPFLGLKIFLDSHPLIPRPETEWWVEELLAITSGKDPCQMLFKEVPQRDGARPSKFSAENYASPQKAFGTGLTVLDLCSGSGAVGCAALARLPNAHVSFGEIDPVHKATILKNIHENNLDATRAAIKIGDLFEPFDDQKFEVIAANPPYIPVERTLDASVTDFEPSLALRSGSDGLDLIRRIATDLPKHLTDEGVAWVECDSAHAAAACALFTDQGLFATIRTDQYGARRVIVVHPVLTHRE